MLCDKDPTYFVKQKQSSCYYRTCRYFMKLLYEIDTAPYINIFFRDYFVKKVSIYGQWEKQILYFKPSLIALDVNLWMWMISFIP